MNADAEVRLLTSIVNILTNKFPDDEHVTQLKTDLEEAISVKRELHDSINDLTTTVQNMKAREKKFTLRGEVDALIRNTNIQNQYLQKHTAQIYSLRKDVDALSNAPADFRAELDALKESLANAVPSQSQPQRGDVSSIKRELASIRKQLKESVSRTEFADIIGEVSDLRGGDSDLTGSLIKRGDELELLESRLEHVEREMMTTTKRAEMDKIVGNVAIQNKNIIKQSSRIARLEKAISADSRMVNLEDAVERIRKTLRCIKYEVKKMKAMSWDRVSESLDDLRMLISQHEARINMLGTITKKRHKQLDEAKDVGELFEIVRRQGDDIGRLAEHLERVAEVTNQNVVKRGSPMRGGQ